MRRTFITVATAVFTFSVASELVCIRLISGPVIHWLERPHREVLFGAFLLINLSNALIAGIFAIWAKRTEALLQKSELRRTRMTGYLNHHVRNALSAIQYAAFLTRDESTQRICNDSIHRIVQSLVNADSEIPANDEDWAIPGRKQDVH